MTTCPDGHQSAATDFCDVCGLEIGGVAVAAAPRAVETAVEGEQCPRCGEPRAGGARFCEGCSYDFVAAPPVAPPVTPPVPDPVPDPVAEQAVPAGEWTATVSADRDYYDMVRAETADDPDAPEVPFPTYCPERVFVLQGDQVRIGRRSRSQGVAPEIDLVGPPADPGISHLHALLVAQADRTWAVVDPGSTNGTTLNHDPDPIAVDTAIPLRDGDRIHVGAWTTITVTLK